MAVLALGDYDGVEVSRQGFFSAAYQPVYRDQEVPYLLMGWHPGALLCLRPEIMICSE